MADILTDDERKAIDDAVAAGRVRKMPFGADTGPTYRYVSTKNQGGRLQMVDAGAGSLSMSPPARRKLAEMKRERWKQVSGLAAQGKDAVEISKVLDLPLGLIVRDLDELAAQTVKRRLAAPKPSTGTGAQVDRESMVEAVAAFQRKYPKMVEMLRSGASHREVAAHFKISRKTISKRLLAAGLKTADIKK